VALWRLKPATEPYDQLESWSTEEARKGSLSALFAALLWLIPRLAPDEHARIARFFGGGRLNATAVKSWLRAHGAAKLFDLKPAREAELVRQRLRFAPRLLASIGLAGWCILLDEAELIGRYSPLQRGRSYAELARWLGLDEADTLPRIATVAAFADDYVDEMFDHRRDEELIPQVLERKGLERQVVLARNCMAELRRRRGIRLVAPDETAFAPLRPGSRNSMAPPTTGTLPISHLANGWPPSRSANTSSPGSPSGISSACTANGRPLRRARFKPTARKARNWNGPLPPPTPTRNSSGWRP